MKMAIGIALGAAIDNVALGVGIGVAIGAALTLVSRSQAKGSDKADAVQ